VAVGVKRLARLSRCGCTFAVYAGRLRRQARTSSRYGGHTSRVVVAHDLGLAPTLILDADTGPRRVAAVLSGRT